MSNAPPFINTKPIRLIELFAGIGSQAKALENLNITFEHYRVIEFDKFAIKSYNAMHGTDFKPTDITEIHGNDLGIVNTDKFTYLLTYLLTYLFLSLPRFICCRNTERNEERKRYKIGFTLGSGEVT